MPGDPLTVLAGRLVDTFADPALDDVRHAMGAAAKKSFLDSAKRDVGADLKLSGLRGRTVKIGAGYDLEADGSVWLNMRPKGLIVLVSDGRKRTTKITPRSRRRRRGGRSALKFAGRYAATSMSRPSRGLDTYNDAVTDMRRSVPAAAARALAGKL